MTIQTYSTNVTDLPSAVTAIYSMLTTAGWTVGGGTIQRPGGGKDFTFTVDNTTVYSLPPPQNLGEKGVIKITCGVGTTVECADVMTCPRTPNTLTAALSYLAPTKVTIFTDPAPGDSLPWCGIVVNFGPSTYRHLYFGYLKTQTTATGGEIVMGHQPVQEYNGCIWNREQAKFPFRHLYGATMVSGGVHIVHASNPNPWRVFSRLTGHNSPPSPTGGDYSNTDIFGGPFDGVNDGYLERSASAVFGAAALVPIELWIPNNSGYLMPVGYPPGVRYFDMTNVQPEAAMSAAGKNWKAFPVTRKQPDGNQYPWVGGSGVYGYDNSFFVGLAYQTP